VHNPYGLVQWERTTAELLSDEGYATALFGKWHLGNTDGRFPIDQGFDEYYGIPNTSSEAFSSNKPADINSGYVKSILEGKKGGRVHMVKEYNEETRREIDNEIIDKSIDFIKRNVKAQKPFYAYIPLTQVHIPTLPSRKFEGKTGNGDWADVLAQIDYNIGQLLDVVDKLKIADNTIFVFTSDNGAEYAGSSTWWNGWAGPWTGSYNTAMEGSLRTPFIICWPGKVPANRVSNEIVHVVDIFPTLAKFTGAKVPTDRAIDGIDQSDFFLGKQTNSNRTGFPIYYGSDLFAVKYKNFKIHYYWKVVRTDVAEKLSQPRVFNLYKNPTERIDGITAESIKHDSRINVGYLEEDVKKETAFAISEAAKIVDTFQKSLEKYPVIPQFSADPYVPNYK
jgi:arylsulfatase